MLTFTTPIPIPTIINIDLHCIILVHALIFILTIITGTYFKNHNNSVIFYKKPRLYRNMFIIIAVFAIVSACSFFKGY